MHLRTFKAIACAHCTWGVCLLLTWCSAYAQLSGNFNVRWLTLAEAQTGTSSAKARIGEHLFTAQAFADARSQFVVARVRTDPEIVMINPGTRVCVSQVKLQTLGSDGAIIANAPLSISIRESDRAALNPQWRGGDLCFAATAPGNYGIRVTSLVAAADHSTRGAQFFIRVNAPSTKTNRPPTPAPGTGLR